MNTGLIDEKIAAEIVVPRSDEVPNGYQRKLSNAAVEEIIKVAKRGIMIPPIFLARVGSSLHCVDGQHRLEAWKQHHFPLGYALSEQMTPDKAAETFIIMDSKMRRVSLAHMVNVHPGKGAKAIREVSSQLGIDPKHVMYFVQGLNNNSTRIKLDCELPIDSNELKRLMSLWYDKKRAESERYYWKVGTLMMLGIIIRKSDNKYNVLKKLKGLRFGDGSRISNCYGTNGGSLSRMRSIAERYILTH